MTELQQRQELHSQVEAAKAAPLVVGRLVPPVLRLISCTFPRTTPFIVSICGVKWHAGVVLVATGRLYLLLGAPPQGTEHSRGREMRRSGGGGHAAALQCPDGGMPGGRHVVRTAPVRAQSW